MSPAVKMLTFAGLGLAMAVTLVVIGLFTGSWWGPKNPILEIALTPGLLLWKLSNWACPPYGERCFLLSERQIAHHVWGFVCYVVAWWGMFTALLAAVWALTARSTRTRAKAARAG